MRIRARLAAIFERWIYLDLAVAVGWNCLTFVVLVSSAVVWDGAVAIVGFLFVLFVPGYVIVSTLFPKTSQLDSSRSGRGSITVLERIVLSVLFSIMTTVFVGLGIDVLPVGFDRWPLFISLTLIVGIGAGIATARRQVLPRDHRFTVTAEQPLSTRRWHPLSGSRLQIVLNVAVVLSVLTAGAAVATDLGRDKSAYTEAYLLSETENGDPVAEDYPTTMTFGEPSELVLGLENHEDKPVDYAVVVKLQQVSDDADGLTVEEETRLATFRESLVAGERVHRQHEITPPRSGESQRLVYLIYDSTLPADPSIDTADQEVHLWVNVLEDSAPDGGSSESSEDSSE